MFTLSFFQFLSERCSSFQETLACFLIWHPRAHLQPSMERKCRPPELTFPLTRNGHVWYARCATSGHIGSDQTLVTCSLGLRKMRVAFSSEIWTESQRIFIPSQKCWTCGKLPTNATDFCCRLRSLADSSATLDGARWLAANSKLQFAA